MSTGKHAKGLTTRVQLPLGNQLGEIDKGEFKFDAKTCLTAKHAKGLTARVQLPLGNELGGEEGK